MYGVTYNSQTDMSALVFSHSLQDTWTQWVECVCVYVCVSMCVRQRKCIGAGSSGCMFEQAAADSLSDDVARATLAATHTHMYTNTRTYKHTHTLNCQHQASYPQ